MKNGLRNLFYACGIFAALSVVVHQWATPAQGAPSTSPPGVAFIHCTFQPGGWQVQALRDDGRAFVCVSNGAGWTELSYAQLPIPVSQVASWAPGAFLDTGGNAWVYQSGAWVNEGPMPGGPTAITPQTWSQIKGQFAPKPGN